MNCEDCPHAKPLMFAVYCKADYELRDLPDSIGHAVKPPLIQTEPPSWCPLATTPTVLSRCQQCEEWPEACRCPLPAATADPADAPASTTPPAATMLPGLTTTSNDTAAP